MLTLSQRVAYLRDSAWQNLGRRDLSCPACGSPGTKLIKRKHLVTELRECSSCCLRFRWPKDRPDDAHRFYQKQYSQGFTTDCPDDQSLAVLLSTGFRNSEKDFSSYVEVLKALGMQPGAAILDFGCSWGYGSWQLSQAGFEVFSYEISAPRARYAAEKLGCNVIESLEALPRKVNCFFSAHVIEHLPTPNLLWDAALDVLVPRGIIVCACPNGNPQREHVVGPDYHKLWGKVHPLYITPDYVREVSKRRKLGVEVYSSPYDLSQIAARLQPANVAGDELLIVASGPL
ncbi:MAG: class I SAM-dependent methyltransferase [Candidatus Acidiferrales bacterium]